jgi:hypothetical protein
MNSRPAVPPLPSLTGSLVVFALREVRTAWHNRFVLVFTTLALLIGFGAAGLSPGGTAVPFILLQVALYPVPLFAVLIGVSSAQADMEEYPYLLSQPVPRSSLVFGKASALGISTGLILLAAFLPALLSATRPGPVFLLWIMSCLLALVFLCLGLAVGYSTRERSRGIVYALVFWLFLLVGFDLIAYAGAHTALAQRQPLLWIAALLINPIDAVRIGMLFRLEEIPFQVPSDYPLISFWMEHLLPWILLVTVLWTAGLLSWSCRMIDRRES